MDGPLTFSAFRASFHDGDHRLARSSSRTNYIAPVMHKNHDDCASHERLGFYDGWGTMIEQLSHRVEGGAE
jgi:hypothetical protein